MILNHPIVSLGLGAALTAAVAYGMVRLRPRYRVAVVLACALGMVWVVNQVADEVALNAHFWNEAEKAKLIFRPVQTITFDLQETADGGDLDLVRLKLAAFQENWKDIVCITKDGRDVAEEIVALGKPEEAQEEKANQ